MVFMEFSNLNFKSVVWIFKFSRIWE